MPDQVLSMNLPQFKACIKGYENHLFDLECLAVHAGYWAGYYSNAKRPKSLSSILKELCKKHVSAEQRDRSSTQIERPDVDVDQFLRREESFNRRRRRR